MRTAAAVAAIEEAALHPEKLADAFEEAARLLGVHSIYLMRLNGDPTQFIASPSFMPAVERYAKEEWWKIDERTVRQVAYSEIHRGFTSDHEVVPEEIRRRSAIYNEFFRQESIDWCSGWRLELDGQQWAFATQKGLKTGPMVGDDANELARFMPALNRAALLTVHTRNARAEGRAEGLDLAGWPAVLLNHEGLCTFASPSAEALFDNRFGVRQGRLWAADPAAQAQLARLVASAINGDETEVLPRAIVKRSNRARPLLVLPVRVRGQNLDLLPGARLIVMLVDLDRQHRPGREVLTAAYGLTSREADIAQALARGLDVQRISYDLSLQASTVRQIIKSVLFKTGTHRQVELVALLAAIPSLR